MKRRRINAAVRHDLTHETCAAANKLSRNQPAAGRFPEHDFSRARLSSPEGDAHMPTHHSDHRPEHSGEAITIMKVDPILDTGIVVTCRVQEVSGKLPDPYSAYFDNRSPPLDWTNVPDVKSWAVIVEDPDAPREKPFVHWMIWDIHGEVTALPEGLPNAEFLATPQGGGQGGNDLGGYGWFGPRPPAGHGLHRYYFQVFALDDFLAMGPDTPLVDLLNALKGHTIAKGEMMATYEAPATH
jgi:Raf kinase inhibitor-like YbhB/YbcL family protein